MALSGECRGGDNVGGNRERAAFEDWNYHSGPLSRLPLSINDEYQRLQLPGSKLCPEPSENPRKLFLLASTAKKIFVVGDQETKGSEE